MVSFANDPMAVFSYALKSKHSKRKYPQRFKTFLTFLGYNGLLKDDAMDFLKEARENQEWVEDKLMQFISTQIDRVNRGEIAAATIANYYKAEKLFCEMNRIRLAWKMIRCGLPSANKAADDRAPRLDEIQRLLEDGDPRVKPIICVMASCGMRVGAWDYLKWKHITPVMEADEDKAQVVAAKVVVYTGQNEGKRRQYVTRISAEAYNALQEWKDYRVRHGEVVTGESWVMRDLFQTENVRRGANSALATNPRQFRSSGIKSLLNPVLWRHGIRVKPEKRHEFKATHGYRKFCMSHAETGGMKSINVKMLMGHSIGIEDSYYRPQERDILEDYKKAIPSLTISENREAIQAKLLDRDNAMQKMKEKYDADIELLKDEVRFMRQLIDSAMSGGGRGC